MKGDHAMKLKWTATGVAALALLIGGAPGSATAEDEGAVEDLILLLQDRGVIEAGDATRIIERNRAVQQKESWADRITFFGDMRARYENFWYDKDPLGVTSKNRSRLRYRLRVGAKTKINDHIDFAFRLATGSDSTSRNQTLGGGGVDFFPDDFNVDQAFITYHPFAEGSIPLDGRKLDVIFGKMPNLFRSKVGKDYLVWDGDITPEGIALTYEVEPAEDVSLTFSTAYFVADENSGTSDPAVFPAQIGVKAGLSDNVTAGGRLSYYAWRYLDRAFYDRSDLNGDAPATWSRSTAHGNIPGGLTDGDSIHIGEVRAWVKCTGIEDWPILAYGSFSKNFSAHSVWFHNAHKEDLAWSVGLEIGDKKKLVHLGAGYFWLEANAVPAQMMDSDLFDARTNGKGWAVYGSKQVYSHTDLKFTLFLGKPLDDNITWNRAVRNSDRVRLQTDLVVKF
jgi:hypothetical protein